MALRSFFALAALSLVAGGFGQNISSDPTGDPTGSGEETPASRPAAPTRVVTRVELQSQTAETPFWQAREGHDEAARRVLSGLSGAGATRVSSPNGSRFPSDYARASQVKQLAKGIERIEALLAQKPTVQKLKELLSQHKAELAELHENGESQNLTVIRRGETPEKDSLGEAAPILLILIAAVAAAIGYALRQ